MTDRIAKIQARLDAATRGPWHWDGHRVPTLIGRAGDPDIYEYDTEVIEATHGGECGCRSVCTLDLEVGPRDAEFIANAPADVAWLLGRLAEAWDAGALHGYRHAHGKPITEIWDDNPHR